MATKEDVSLQSWDMHHDSATVQVNVNRVPVATLVVDVARQRIHTVEIG